MEWTSRVIDQHRLRSWLGAVLPCKGESVHCAGVQSDVSVVSALNESLHVRFEGILISVNPSRDIVLDLLETAKQVDRRLLITRWRSLQVCQATLKVQRLVVVLQKPSRNSCVERNARQAIEGFSRREGDFAVRPVD